MKISQVNAVVFASLAAASPVVPSPENNQAISDIIGNFLPQLLGNIESIAHAGTPGYNVDTVLESIGIIALPEKKEKRSVLGKRSTQEEMGQVTHVISTLANGAIGFAKYAHLDSVANMLSKVDPELAAKA